MLPTLPELSMLPRGRLRLMLRLAPTTPTATTDSATLVTTVLDTPDLLATPATPTLTTMALATPTTPTPSLPQLTAEDFLVDLGCGRGTINICAATQFKCGGLGVDIDGALVDEARKEAEEKGVGQRVEFREEDVATTDLTSATAITSFLVPRQLRILQPTLLKFLARGGKL